MWSLWGLASEALRGVLGGQPSLGGRCERRSPDSLGPSGVVRAFRGPKRPGNGTNPPSAWWSSWPRIGPKLAGLRAISRFASPPS